MDARAEYLLIAKRSLAKTLKQFNARARAILDKAGVTEPTPEQWLQAARCVSFPCRRCGGTGQFVTMIVNRVLTGPGGICFRCNGKGQQNDADRRRNYGYDRYYVAARVA